MVGLAACLTVISRKVIIDRFIVSMELDKALNKLDPEIAENKIKVKYPLFMKKNKDNMFIRAQKDHFKRTRKLRKRAKPTPSPQKATGITHISSSRTSMASGRARFRFGPNNGARGEKEGTASQIIITSRAREDPINKPIFLKK